jgi:hypothetical protein
MVRLTKLLNDVDHTVGEASRAALSPGVMFLLTGYALLGIAAKHL